MKLIKNRSTFIIYYYNYIQKTFNSYTNILMSKFLRLYNTSINLKNYIFKLL